MSKSLFEQHGGTYRQVGDYLIPNLTISPEERNITLGKWGMMYKEHLRKSNQLQFTLLLTKGELFRHCAEIEQQAKELFSRLVDDMAKAEGVTEQLKSTDQMEWVRRRNNIEARARDIVCNEIIYT